MPPTVAVAALYSNPVSVCSPFPTAGNVMSTSAGFPAASVTVTVAFAVLLSAVSGVPLITPLPASMLSPPGSPLPPYAAMSLPPAGLIAAMATPTFSAVGAVYVGAVGATRSIVSVRCTFAAAVYPAFVADTVTDTLVPVMYVASPATSTDQFPLPSLVSVCGVCEPMVTVTVAPLSLPVSPAMANPSAFSAMLIVSSPVICSTFRVRVLALCTVPEAG